MPCLAVKEGVRRLTKKRGFEDGYLLLINNPFGKSWSRKASWLTTTQELFHAWLGGNWWRMVLGFSTKHHNPWIVCQFAQVIDIGAQVPQDKEGLANQPKYAELVYWIVRSATDAKSWVRFLDSAPF